MQAPGAPPQAGEGGGPTHPPPPPPPPAASKPPSPLEADLAALAAPDVARPFSSVGDAVARLLPYHLLAQAGPEACDADALQGASSSTRLLLGRRAALAEVGILSVRAVADGVARSAGAAQALAAALDAGPLGLPPPQGTEGEPRPEDGWLLARLAAGAEAAALKEARRAAAAAGVVLRPPPPAVPPPSLHAPPPLVSGSVVPPPPQQQAPPATAYPPYALVKPPPPPPPPPPSTAYGRQ